MSKTLVKDLEVRVAPQTVEFRASSTDGQLGTLYGYAAVFNRLSQNLGGFVEQVDPAAFNKSLADQVPVMCRYNHEDDGLLGTTWADTLRLSVDDTGLAYEVDLPDTQAGRDCKALAARGDLKWSSFAFRTIEDEWTFTDQGFPLRTLKGVLLIDVAPVNSPAYLDTTVAARSLTEHAAEVPQDPAEGLTDDSRSAGEEEPGAADAPHSSLALRRLRLELDAKQ